MLVRHAITFTLSPLFCKRNTDPRDQWCTSLEYLDQFFLKNTCITFKISLIPELTKNYNVHWHGLFTYKVKPEHINWFAYEYNNDISYYLQYQFRTHKLLKQCFGFLLLKLEDGTEGWADYIRKDRENTLKLLKVNRLGYLDQWDLTKEQEEMEEGSIGKDITPTLCVHTAKVKKPGESRK